MKGQDKFLKFYLNVLNELFEIEKKQEKLTEANSIHRNTNRAKTYFEKLPDGEDIGLFIENPLGQKYDETRIDLDANIAGEGVDNLVVIEVIKPVIRLKSKGIPKLVQKGIVIVESQKIEA